MKAFFFCLLAFLLMSFAPEGSEPFKLTLPIIAALVAGIWEVVGRIVPSLGQITVIGKLIEILSWISNFLNHKKR